MFFSHPFQPPSPCRFCQGFLSQLIRPWFLGGVLLVGEAVEATVLVPMLDRGLDKLI